jgi:hypothetical protein
MLSDAGLWSLQVAYTLQVKRCDEMARKLRFFMEQVSPNGSRKSHDLEKLAVKQQPVAIYCMETWFR